LLNIDWNEYKEYKQYSVRDDNFEVLIDFLKSYYNLTHPSDMFESIYADDIGKMMLEKRNILDAEALEYFLRNF